MATYKLIQDIEAEDHILGPLSLRQFIYGLVAAFSLYMCFIGLTKHVWPMLAIFLPVALFTGFFAFPFGKDQPTEVWALAKIRFLFKPRRRIWDQSGVKELVTVTAPKKIERTLTDGLSQTEVHSRLKALANTIDSRGWAIKNVNINMYGQPPLLATTGSDRLIDINNLPQLVPEYDVTASDDMLDEGNNPVAQQFSQMINASTQAHRRQLVDELNGIREVQTKQGSAPADYWFLNQPTAPTNLPADNTVFQGQVVLPGGEDGSTPSDVTAEEAAVVARAKQKKGTDTTTNSHLRTIQPLDAAPQRTEANDPPSTTAAKQPDPVIQNLAGRNDLNIDTLARQAKRDKESGSDGEVTISLR